MNLFEPWTARSVTLRNRIVVSPMCQYSSVEGLANDWHFVHLGAFATGGAGLVFTEATAVAPEGRISPQDLGIYRDDHIPELRKITHFIKAYGAVPGMQLGHAGRKASTPRLWDGGYKVEISEGGWEPIAPSAIPFRPEYPMPRAMTDADIEEAIGQFVAGARRAKEAGFEVVELHGAHGYLIHQFLSPLSNHRTDSYGGSLENRFRFLGRVSEAVRAEWGQSNPIFVRLSATEWTDDGFNLEEAIQVSAWLKQQGVDLIDVSSAGNTPRAEIPVGPGYQVPLAQQIRDQAKIPVGAVGMITDPVQAETILATGQADLVFLAREMLRNPNWPFEAARELGVKLNYIPNQNLRAWPN